MNTLNEQIENEKIDIGDLKLDASRQSLRRGRSNIEIAGLSYRILQVLVKWGQTPY